jgi:hypothetical protein
MKHKANARVRGSKVTQAAAAIALQRGNCQRRQGLGGGGGIVLTNDKTGTVKDIPPYGETECTRNWLPRGLEKHTVGIYGLSVRLEGMARKGFPVFYHRLSLEHL